ncbi:MAG: ParB/RepB/Spo0J family partition protein [Hyphomicrobiaceae bacterium]|nr:ParB/RepB/Spo0J family partition protein [Hyphomicrobiaceae bacterium]
MAATKRRLGRGLASLINEEASVAAVTGIEGLRTVAIEAVRSSPLNPRNDFSSEDLRELAESIRTRGVVQPIIVRPAEGNEAAGGFEIIAGERRWRAAQTAGLHEIPVIVRELTDQQALELAIIENVQRSDLNAMEEAAGYQKLIKTYKYTQEDLAGIVGKSRSHLTNTLRLLRLPGGVQELIRDGELSAGHARALVGLEDAEQVARDIVKRGLNVRAVEALVQRKNEGSDRSKRKRVVKDANTRFAERELRDALGLSVQIVSGKGERGELRIAYTSLEQFEELRARLLKR